MKQRKKLIREKNCRDFAGGVKSWYVYDIKQISIWKSCTFFCGSDRIGKRKKRHTMETVEEEAKTHCILPHDTLYSIESNWIVYWMSKINELRWRGARRWERKSIWCTKWKKEPRGGWHSQYLPENKQMNDQKTVIKAAAETQIRVDVRGCFKRQWQQ